MLLHKKIPATFKRYQKHPYFYHCTCVTSFCLNVTVLTCVDQHMLANLHVQLCVVELPKDHRFDVFDHDLTRQWGFYPHVPQALRDRATSDQIELN